MAARLPGGNVQAMQQFIGRSPWDHHSIRKKLADRMAGEMVPAFAWIVNDTGFPKQGKRSVGVARQYSGTLGKVENCQIAVSLNLATVAVCMPVGFELYLPKAWTDDPPRMQNAGVPDGYSLFMFEKWGVGIYLGNSPLTVPTLGTGSLAELEPISDVEYEHKEVCGRKNPDEPKSGLF
jgi:SRSO17 transposase